MQLRSYVGYLTITWRRVSFFQRKPLHSGFLAYFRDFCDVIQLKQGKNLTFEVTRGYT